MATTYSAGPNKVQVNTDLELIRAGFSNLVDNVGLVYTGASFSSGTGPGNKDRRYIAQLTIAASGTATVNLSSFADAFGNTVAMLRVKTIYVELTKGTAAASILVGGGSNPFANWLVGTAPQLRVRNGMAQFLGDANDATGYVVVPSTGDQFKLTNEDAGLAAIVNVMLDGCSA
jgi:hypothetical protein